jgi:hypothetical protein
MNYYTEDFWQGEMLNPSLYNTVLDNIDTDQCVMGGGKKTDWKFHMMGLRDVDILMNWIDACLPHAAMHVGGGESTDDYGACIINDKAMRISESWGIHYNKGEYVAKHNHFPFAMSFNYCVTAPKGCSPFILEGEEIEPVPGRIVFFHAHKNHCTLPNETDGRCMIVGNIVYDPELLKP